MTPTIRDLGLDQLSPEDRLSLADALWNSVEGIDDESPLSAEHVAELDRRIALTDTDPDRGNSWEAVRRAAASRHTRS